MEVPNVVVPTRLQTYCKKLTLSWADPGQKVMENWIDHGREIQNRFDNYEATTI